MNLFDSESKMQEWLSKQLERIDGLDALIVNREEIVQFKPSNYTEKRILHSYKTSLESLCSHVIFSENENISLKSGEILKPDFVLYSPDKETVVIIELKNLKGATREAGTELAAYSSELKSIVPFLSDGDIVHVLISTEWPTLLMHYVRNEIFWQNKNLLLLQPIENMGAINLEILSVDRVAEDIMSFKIAPEYLGGFHICLYDYERNSEPLEINERERLDDHVEMFKSALIAMSTTGNRLNSHGFAFLWKDMANNSLAPYSITVINFAPFQSIERFCHLNQKLHAMIVKMKKLVLEHLPEGHGHTLVTITNSCINLLEGVCSPIAEDCGDWRDLKHEMINRANYIAFMGWGIFGEMQLDKLNQRYRLNDNACSLMSPQIGLEVIADIVDDEYPFIRLNCYGEDDKGNDEEIDLGI